MHYKKRYRSQSPKQREASIRNWAKLRSLGIAASLKVLEDSEYTTSICKKHLNAAEHDIKEIVDSWDKMVK